MRCCILDGKFSIFGDKVMIYSIGVRYHNDVLHWFHPNLFVTVSGIFSLNSLMYFDFQSNSLGSTLVEELKIMIPVLPVYSMVTYGLDWTGFRKKSTTLNPLEPTQHVVGYGYKT